MSHENDHENWQIKLAEEMEVAGALGNSQLSLIIYLRRTKHIVTQNCDFPRLEKRLQVSSPNKTIQCTSSQRYATEVRESAASTVLSHL